jgi:hypothetical protein
VTVQQGENDLDLHDAKKSMLREKGIQEIDLQMERLVKALGPVAALMGGQQIDDSRRLAIRQLDIVLDCAVQYGSRPLNEIVDEHMAAFKKNDMYADYYDRDHHRYGKLQDIMAEWFSSRITAMGELYRGEKTTYDDLVRERFPAKEAARSVLGKELAAGTKAVRLVEENPGLLKLPFGTNVHTVVDYMKEELEISFYRLFGEIDRIYSS